MVKKGIIKSGFPTAAPLSHIVQATPDPPVWVPLVFVVFVVFVVVVVVGWVALVEFWHAAGCMANNNHR